MPNVAYIRPELARMLPRYNLIRDCLIGSEAVKAKGTLYLPQPNPDDKSKENKQRYISYVQRAVFYNVTAKTLKNIVGMVSSADPVSEIPDSLDKIEFNADGGGVSLAQMAEGTLRYTLSYGRSGLLVDYPYTGGNVTAADVESGKARPTITQYSPFSIVNWRYVLDGAVQRLTMVNIAESWPYVDDGFEIKTACQFRILQLNEKGEYTVSIWREPENYTNWTTGNSIPTTRKFVLTEGPYLMCGADGAPLKEILFKFVGVLNNDSSIDEPPIYDLADLNIAHYRNSADYEEACYRLGQPTYWFSGLDENWVKTVLNGKIEIGSMGGVLLPVNGSAGLLQAAPNGMVKEAMEIKERQMVALGAKLTEQKTVQRTATEANQDNTSETSILSSAAKNVSSAYEWALLKCAELQNITVSKIIYQLKSDFRMTQITAADRAQLLKEYQSGSITFAEYRAVLRKCGIATEDDATAAEIIAREQATAFTAAAKMVKDNGGE